jgi:exodeoxyribonuclease VII large subunit
MVVPDAGEWRQRLDGAFAAMQSFQRFRVQRLVQRLSVLEAKLRHPRDQLSQNRQSLTALAHRFSRCKPAANPAQKLSELIRQLRAARPAIDLTRAHLNQLAQHLQAGAHARLDTAARTAQQFNDSMRLLAPERVLARGYAWVTRDNGTVISSAAHLHAGELIKIALKDGEVNAEIVDHPIAQNLSLF